MFWGLILEPYKRYTQTVQKSFHITNAALDVTTGDNDPCQMMVGAQGKDFLICTLQKGKSVQTPLQLFFAEGSEISFTSSGKCVMHLTGFLEPEDFMDEEEDDEEESGSEAEDNIIVSSNGKKDKKRKADSSLEENGIGKKSKNDQGANKKQKIQADESSDDDDDESDTDIAKLLQDDEDSDENDDTYVPNDSAEIQDLLNSDEDDDDDDDDDEDENDEDDSDDDSEADATVQEEVPSEKKQKNKKDKGQQNGISEKKNKSNKENEQKVQQQKPEQAGKPAIEKKVLNGNVAIEDLKVGQGQVAKQGKMVQVYYEGKLKSNNKTFDSCLKGPGFKFKLGKKEVIPGWEIGIAGMRIGGKRRIVIPPGMAYGKKGSPPVIPPNSTLVFDVELKNIN